MSMPIKRNLGCVALESSKCLEGRWFVSETSRSRSAKDGLGVLKRCGDELIST